MNTLIQSGDDSIEAKYAREIMHSYIKSRSDYERVLIMSAMMVANKNIGSDAGNIGTALKLFLENMGPAEIKLGQAIASHPNTPKKIRTELQKLKNAADLPARWTLYDWIKNENIPEALWKDRYLGNILGSASYYTTVALGQDKVLRILRPEAREKAAKGFNVIHATVDDLREKDKTSELSYRELTGSVQEMVLQAAKMSDIETDHEVGQKQYESAKNLYDGVTLKSGSERFTLKVMDWRVKGKNWVVMDRAKGVTFNALPEETPEQRAYKNAFAKAYVVFEIGNILSGRKFDHDRHGAQLSIDPQTNTVGVYDTGAMAVQEPLPEQQRLLGNVIYDVLRDSFAGKPVFETFARVIGDRVENLHRNHMDTQYLVEVKKGMLALGDFFRLLSPNDMRDVLLGINFATNLSADVLQGITEKMSNFERAQYQGFLAMQSFKGNTDVFVQRTEEPATCSLEVQTSAAIPGVPDKAAWFKGTFANEAGGTKEEKGRYTRPSDRAQFANGRGGMPLIRACASPR